MLVSINLIIKNKQVIFCILILAFEENENTPCGNGLVCKDSMAMVTEEFYHFFSDSKRCRTIGQWDDGEVSPTYMVSY